MLFIQICSQFIVESLLILFTTIRNLKKKIILKDANEAFDKIQYSWFFLKNSKLEMEENFNMI